MGAVARPARSAASGCTTRGGWATVGRGRTTLVPRAGATGARTASPERTPTPPAVEDRRGSATAVPDGAVSGTAVTGLDCAAGAGAGAAAGAGAGAAAGGVGASVGVGVGGGGGGAGTTVGAGRNVSGSR
ncbi:MAG TPA: hypothetical protein VFU51_13635 [Gaiellaceae bacterium]|nr:hypothetical protein [Gaiellaceae bacterium]